MASAKGEEGDMAPPVSDSVHNTSDANEATELAPTVVNAEHANAGCSSGAAAALADDKDEGTSDTDEPDSEASGHGHRLPVAHGENSSEDDNMRMSAHEATPVTTEPPAYPGHDDSTSVASGMTRSSPKSCANADPEPKELDIQSRSVQEKLSSSSRSGNCTTAQEATTKPQPCSTDAEGSNFALGLSKKVFHRDGASAGAMRLGAPSSPEGQRRTIEDLEYREKELLKEKTRLMEQVSYLKTSYQGLEHKFSQVMERMEYMDRRQAERSDRLEEMIETMRQEYREAMDQKQSELDASLVREEELKKEAGALKSKVEASQNSVTELAKRVEELEAENRHLRAQVDDYESRLGIISDSLDIGSTVAVPEQSKGIEEVHCVEETDSSDSRRLEDIIEFQASVARHVGGLESFHSRTSDIVAWSGPKPCMVLGAPCQDTSCKSDSSGDCQVQKCTPCQNGGVVLVPIVHPCASGKTIARSLGLTEVALSHRRNHLCLHGQLARLFCQGCVIVFPDWHPETGDLCSPVKLRLTLFNEDVVFHKVKQKPDCVLGESDPMTQTDQRATRLANLHGDELQVPEEDEPGYDLLAIKIWFVFRSALQQKRRLPKFDLSAGRFGEEFAEVTSELLDHVWRLCIALFNLSVDDPLQQANFLKATYMNNALQMIKNYHG